MDFPTPEETNILQDELMRENIQSKYSPALQSFSSFLREMDEKCRNEKGNLKTNIVNLKTGHCYNLQNDDAQILFTHLETLRKNNSQCHFNERQVTSEYNKSGIMLDFDIMTTNKNIFLHKRQANRILEQIIETIRDDIIFPIEQPEITSHAFFILKNKPKIKSENKYKYGFHILIPGLHVSKGYKIFLIQKLQEDSVINKIIEDLGGVLNDDSNKYLDNGSSHVPVFLFGSCKLGGEPYILKYSFEFSFYCAYSNNQSRPNRTIYRPIIECNLNEIERSNYNMVAEMSISFEAKYYNSGSLVKIYKCDYQPDLEPDIRDLESRKRKNLIDEDELLLNTNSLSILSMENPEAQYLHQILNLLDKSFYTIRNKWRDVIFALANTDESFKPLAEWFSHKCPEKWIDGGRDSLNNIWDSAISSKRDNTTNKLTSRSIYRWAKECNPEQFYHISNKNYFKKLTNFVHEHNGILEHAMVAEVLYSMLGNKFKVDVDKNLGTRNPYVWFEFVVPGQASCPGELWKWRREAEPDELHKYISKNLIKIFNQVSNYIDEQKNEAENENNEKYYTKLKSNFMISKRKIFNDTFKNGVIKQANYLFRRDRDFIGKLDKDPNYIGIGNGVLQLGSVCKLIDHFHEIPIMKFTPVPYKKFDPTDSWTKLMLNAMQDIIPEPDFRNWLLFFAASSLAGGVKEGILLLWHGGGANGKTWFMRMVAKVLGNQYASKLDIGLLTAERSKPNAPNSAMMQLKDCRWGYVEETQKSEPLNSQRLKEMVNPGEVSGNEKFKKQEIFEITANIAVGQNYDFVVDTTDHGTWRRLKHYHSKIRFCSNPDPSNPYEKKDDQRYVREYINNPYCQEAFFSILAHYYERLQREHDGLLKNISCPTLDRETEKFRNSQDTVNHFITQSIVYSPGSGIEYSLADISQYYNDWYDKNIGARNHTSSENIQDLENSALRKYIHRAPNKTMVLRDCRYLSSEDPNILDGESYLGTLMESTESIKSDEVEILQHTDNKKWWEHKITIPDKNSSMEMDDIIEIENDEPTKLTQSKNKFMNDQEFDNLLGSYYEYEFTSADVFNQE